MSMFALTDNFNYFFARLNPSPTFIQQASREHENIRSLIENSNGQAGVLSPKCFLQGSYKQDTAIYTINDVDIVVLCKLWQPGSKGTGATHWSRNEIFSTIAAPIVSDGRYRDKVRFNDKSMCIKIDLGIKIEILPVVYKAGNNDATTEPFRLFRPENQQWEDGYARYHQQLLSIKNRLDMTESNFKPAIKVFKHLRSLYNLDAVSFHIESLLYALPNILFFGNPADYIHRILTHILKWSADEWYITDIKTPCGERSLFTESEWTLASWRSFYRAIEHWAKCADLACTTDNKNIAIEAWQLLLDKNYFPKQTM